MLSLVHKFCLQTHYMFTVWLQFVFGVSILKNGSTAFALLICFHFCGFNFEFAIAVFIKMLDKVV